MLDVLSYVNERKRAMAYEVSRLPRAPRLAIVTDDRNFGANQSYIRSKTQFALDVGVACDVIVLKDEDEFIANAADYDGIIVQYPFRDYTFSEFRDFVSTHVPLDKDVDGLGYYASYKPCTPLGIYNYLEQLRATDVIKGHVTVNVVGCGGLVGEPLVNMLLKDSRYTVCVTRSTTPPNVAKEFEQCANVVVCATPKHNLIEYPDLYKVYVDCGCNLVNGKLLGNVSRQAYCEEALITPVPNGVGRLTVLALFDNVLTAYQEN